MIYFRALKDLIKTTENIAYSVDSTHNSPSIPGSSTASEKFAVNQLQKIQVLMSYLTERMASIEIAFGKEIERGEVPTVHQILEKYKTIKRPSSSTGDKTSSSTSQTSGALIAPANFKRPSAPVPSPTSNSFFLSFSLVAFSIFSSYFCLHFV